MTWAWVGLMLMAPRPALDELALRTIEPVEALKLEAPVGVWVEGSPAVLARTFASAVAAQLAQRNKGPTVVDAGSAAEAEAAALRLDVRTLLRLSIHLDGNRLIARGDALPVWVNFWAGSKPRREGTAASLAAAVEADAQALVLAAAAPRSPGPTGPLKLTLSTFARLSGPPAALAFGDIDGDGKGELSVLVDDGVSVFDAEGRPRGRVELRDVPPARSPSREPFGALTVLSNPARLLAFSSRHSRAAAIGWKGNKAEVTASDLPLSIDSVTVRPAPGLNAFDKAVWLGGRATELPTHFTAACSRLGQTLFVFPDGSAQLWDGSVSSGRLSGAGAASALADVDGDGTAELLVSSTRYTVDGDELKVLALNDAKAIGARAGSITEAPAQWQGTTPRGKAIVALAAPIDTERGDELILGIWLGDGTGELLLAKVAP